MQTATPPTMILNGCGMKLQAGPAETFGDGWMARATFRPVWVFAERGVFAGWCWAEQLEPECRN